jgi:hypothetical protein
MVRQAEAFRREQVRLQFRILERFRTARRRCRAQISAINLPLPPKRSRKSSARGNLFFISALDRLRRNTKCKRYHSDY